MICKSLGRTAAILLAATLLASCNPPGGGGSNSNSGGPSGSGGSANQVWTSATQTSAGGWGRVDVVNGGIPLGAVGASVAPNPGLRFFYDQITKVTKKGGDYEVVGIDFDGDYHDTNLDGIADAGFDTYILGKAPGASERIIGANNVYDLFQTVTGPADVTAVTAPAVAFTGYNGGDADGDGQPDGGPGLFSMVVPTVPTLPVLPAFMGAARGPEVGENHQFVQIEFPYNVDPDSIFDASETGNSFLGNSITGEDNVLVEARWVQVENGVMVDQTKQHRHVSGVMIVGGITAVPIADGTSTRSVIDKSDPALSFVPAGARTKVFDKNVVTFIANENPVALRDNPIGDPKGYVDAVGILRLPDPADLTASAGGRVFGGTTSVPDAVNDFALVATPQSAPMGFFSLEFKTIDVLNGQTVKNAYFHNFDFDQSNVGADPRTLTGSFNRGPAIAIDVATRLPSIDISSATYAIGTYDATPPSDNPLLGGNTISTRARFRVDFDKEVIPNSLGFSKRFTAQRTDEDGIIFPFAGNVTPKPSPAFQLVGGIGGPTAPSIYLAVNTPAGVNNAAASNLNGFRQKVNSPIAHAVATFDGTDFFYDDGATAITPAEMPGLNPIEHNTTAEIPRGVVPIDIYPLNQNNLQSYIIEPLVELPPGSTVTLGVCVNGLGISALGVPNMGNNTRSGAVFTPYQGVTFVGLADDETLKTQVFANQTIVKVNAGPMDLYGNLFYGGTTAAIDIKVNGNPTDDQQTGGFNVARTFFVGFDDKKVYLNAPVSPQALYLGLDNGGVSIVDLAGTGFNTNAPGGGVDNVAFKDHLVVSRYLSTTILGNLTNFNWNSIGSLADGDHLPAYGILSRWTAGFIGSNAESDYGLGGAVGLGSLTPVPGVNEGSSGYQTLVKNSAGSTTVSPKEIKLLRDMVVGDFLDTVWFDQNNQWAVPANHRTYNTPLQGSMANNSIADPPFPNPPPLRFPAGLPHTQVRFDQDDLDAPPFLIDGNEAFTADGFMAYDDGSGFSAFSQPVNTFIQLNIASNLSNQNVFDIPPLPNAGFNSPFGGFLSTSTPKFVQTGPMPKTATTGAIVLSTLNSPAGLGIGTSPAGGLVSPTYQSRQQIGNFLFMTDGITKTLYALNSNNMEILAKLKLPDPYGMAITPDLETLFVTNEGDNSVSIVDADPRSASFLSELKRLPVGQGPRGIGINPDNEDVLILNFSSNTITIVDITSKTVRKTLNTSNLNRPFDIAVGMRETGAANVPGFQSGTYHAFISNNGAHNVLIYESGPDGLAGIGFDDIIGSVRPNDPPQQGQPEWQDMFEPRGITYDPITPLDTFSGTIGAFVAHRDQNGRGVVSRIAYTKDSSPGSNTFNTGTATPGFGTKVFEVKAQYVSTFAGEGLDVALPDFNRKRLEDENFGTFYNLLNAGATVKNVGVFSLERNSKYPLADNILPTNVNGPRWEPDHLYLTMEGGIIDVFKISSGNFLKRIDVGKTVTTMRSFFSQ